MNEEDEEDRSHSIARVELIRPATGSNLEFSMRVRLPISKGLESLDNYLLRRYPDWIVQSRFLISDNSRQDHELE